MTREFRISSRRGRRRAADGAAKRNRSSSSDSERCATETLSGGLRLRAGKGCVHERRWPSGGGSANSRSSFPYPKMLWRKLSMSVKQQSQRGLAALFVGVVIAGFIFVGASALNAAAKRQVAPEQDKDKKEEKKDEKKDEKKGLPLKSDRKVEFTTDEGTGLSLDVSPDGKTIVFELLGDIYTLPIEGGQAKLVSAEMAVDSQPKFSPDGRWIAIISDRNGSENLWIMHPDGSAPQQLTEEPWSEFASPAWSPEGDYVLVSRGG